MRTAKRRPPEHIGEPRPEPLPPLDRFKVEGVNEPRLLRWLLAESIRRLRAARQLEVIRKIVYPETTSILRDVERIARRLNSLTNSTATQDTAELKEMLNDSNII